MDKKPSGNQSNSSWRKNASTSNQEHKPDPKRFEVFDLIEDETGFTIPGCDHIFYFDQYGGWYDEYDNYYNANGEPCTPPEYSGDEDDYYDDEDPADDLAREYDMDGDDDDEDHVSQKYDAIYTAAENKRRLALYAGESEVDFEIRNINWKCTEDDFQRNFLTKHGFGDNFEFYYNERNRFTGTAFVTVDKKLAEKLLSFHDYKFWGRNLKISVMVPEEVEEEDVDQNLPVEADLPIQQPEEEKVEPASTSGTGTSKEEPSTQTKSEIKTQSENKPETKEPTPQASKPEEKEAKEPKKEEPVDIRTGTWGSGTALNRGGKAKK